MAKISLYQFRKSCRNLWGGRWCVSLAHKMGVHPDEIFAIESGDSPITDAHINALSESIKERIDGLENALSTLEVC